jgi:hypothetical protein
MVREVSPRDKMYRLFCDAQKAKPRIKPKANAIIKSLYFICCLSIVQDRHPDRRYEWLEG